MSIKKEKKSLGPTYKGITFAVGYNKNFADFKKEFEDIHIFKDMQPADREVALNEAWKIATDGNLKTTATKGDDPK